MGVIAKAIKEKLDAKFNPTQLDVIDESHKHSGHAGAREHAAEHGPSSESHLHVVIRSEALTELSRLGRHRAVMDAIAEEMKSVHALSLDAG